MSARRESSGKGGACERVCKRSFEVWACEVVSGRGEDGQRMERVRGLRDEEKSRCETRNLCLTQRREENHSTSHGGQTREEVSTHPTA